jgi:pimeloyl-ACP methyl ester carboxylesterase
MHGILDHGAAWDSVAGSLAARGYQVVAPDLRGHGRSAHISTTASYNFMDFVADLDAIASRLASPFTLVGHSMGAAIAAAYTAVRPAQVRSLILIELPTLGGRSIDGLRVHLDALSDWAPHAVFPNATVALQAIRHANPRMTSDQARVMAARLTEPCLGGVRWRWDARLRTLARIAYSSTSGLTEGRFIEMLRSNGPPTTLIYGSNSELLPRSDVDSFVQAANGVRAIWLDGGHNLHHDAADVLARIIHEHAWGSAGERVSAPREVYPLEAETITGFP